MKKNDIIWVRDNSSEDWRRRYFSHYKDSKVCCGYGGFKPTGFLISWKFYSKEKPQDNG